MASGSKSTTSYENKLSILADFWLNYKNDEDYEDFFEYNDIGLPLAYLLSNEIVSGSDKAEKFINETFGLFLEGLEVKDQGFESLDEILSEV